MSTATLEVPETDNARGIELAQYGAALAITTIEGAEAAKTFLKDVKAYRDEIESLFGPARDAAHLAHKTITTKIKELLAPVDAEDKAVRLRLSVYIDRVERERLAEQRRQQEAAEVAARAEQARLQAEADAKALAEQAAAQELEDMAAEAMSGATGESVAAAVVELAPVVVAPVAPQVVTLPPQKVAGLSGRKTWDFQITDEASVPRRFLMVDEVKLRRYVVAMGDAEAVPGVKIFQKTTVNLR